jgi:hypothetical protein
VYLLRINQRPQLWVAKYTQRKRFVSPVKLCKISKNSRVLVGFQVTPNTDLTTLHMNLASTQVKRKWLTSSGCPQRAHCPYIGNLVTSFWEQTSYSTNKILNNSSVSCTCCHSHISSTYHPHVMLFSELPRLLCSSNQTLSAFFEFVVWFMNVWGYNVYMSFII